MIDGILLTLTSYLLGSFPTSLLAGRAFGVDLRQEGSGNLGATNAYRVLGLGPALVVLGVDFFKGFLPVYFFPVWVERAAPWALIYGMAAIAGHVWPVYSKFKGGKGVATGAGTLTAVAPIASAISFLVWVGFAIGTRTASVSSLMAAALLPIFARAAAGPRSVVTYALLLAVMVWWTHRTNIVRIIRREELELEWSPRSVLRDPKASRRRRTEDEP